MAEKRTTHKPQKEEEPQEAKPVEGTSKTELDTSNATSPTKKKFYKRAWFWIVVVAAIIVIGLGIFFGIQISQQNKNKQVITQGWHDLILESNTVNVLADKVVDQATYNTYSTELHKLDSLIDDEEYKSQKLAGNYNDVQHYKGFLIDFNRYVSDGASHSDKVAEYTTENNTSLTDLSKVAKESADNLKSSASYITENMSPKTFTIQDTLTKVRDEIVNKVAAEKAQQAATAAQAQADAKNMSLVQQTSNGFLTAFIAGNAAQLRQYMTQPFQNEYDFNQLTPESRQYTYPASYRLLSTKNIDEATYKTQANVTYKNHGNSGQYTVGQEFTVINSSGTWLINSMKEGSSY